ncbi:MAG TPA: ZIP zinc transporter [Gammaproteobacteria bacterium]|nr:ZIP zinc transporter [Gammaproteobacteria bacterium]
MLLFWIILFSLFGGVLSVAAAGSYLLFSADVRNKTLEHLISYAVGALLGVSFIALLPHAFDSTNEAVSSLQISVTLLCGIFIFFILEKMVLWRHHHHHPGDEEGEHLANHREKSSGVLILLGDSIHNGVDGILIAAAFLTDFDLGVLTALAVATHEIPQELGDFAILLAGGMNRTKALLFNLLVSLTTVVGAVVGYFALEMSHSLLPYLLALAAASFIYIAVADLLPNLNRKIKIKDTFSQLGLMGSGVATIWFLEHLLH